MLAINILKVGYPTSPHTAQGRIAVLASLALTAR
jgi:hypothetical protein